MKCVKIVYYSETRSSCSLGSTSRQDRTLILGGIVHPYQQYLCGFWQKNSGMVGTPSTIIQNHSSVFPITCLQIFCIFSAHISSIWVEFRQKIPPWPGTSPFHCFPDHMFTDSTYFLPNFRSFAASLALCSIDIAPVLSCRDR